MNEIVIKGPIGAQDFYTGANATFTRGTSTGGTLTLNKFPYEIDALISYGGGTSYTSATINAAITALGSGTAEILIRPGAWAITAPVVFTSKIQPKMAAGAYFVISGAGSVTGLSYVDPQWFGAKCDDTTVDNTAFQKAVASLTENGVLFIPNKGTLRCKITDTIPITTAGIKVKSDGGKILMALPLNHATGRLFYVTSPDVSFDGLEINATGQTYTQSTPNMYGIMFSGAVGAYISNPKVTNCRFIDLKYTGTGGGPGQATHAVYATYTNNLVVKDNTFSAPSGAAVFVTISENSKVLNNIISDTGWYSIQYQQSCHGFEIAGNIITGTSSGIRNYGGSINLMSDTYQIRNGSVHHNYISGVHSYGTAISGQSIQRVTIDSNVIDSVTGAAPIRIETRNTPGFNAGASCHLNITNNLIIPGDNDAVAIYIDNADGGTGTAGVAYGITITGNQIPYIDGTHVFTGAIWLHGQAGGIEGFTITGNDITGIPGTGALNGLISATTAKYGIIEGNALRYGPGTAAATTDIGIALDDGADYITVSRNSLDGFYYSIRTFTNAGTHNGYFDSNVFVNIPAGGSKTNEVVPQTRAAEWIINSSAWDPGNIASDGAIVATTVSVPGAILGKPAYAGHSSIGTDNILVSAHVTANDSVQVILLNKTGGAKDVATGTLYISVLK